MHLSHRANAMQSAKSAVSRTTRPWHRAPLARAPTWRASHAFVQQHTHLYPDRATQPDTDRQQVENQSQQEQRPQNGAAAPAEEAAQPTTVLQQVFEQVQQEQQQIPPNEASPSQAEAEAPAAPQVDEHQHFSSRKRWLRSFILGANDGLVSTAALMLGMAGGAANLDMVRLSGISAWIAGALSMAVGEYISVSGQRDMEEADVDKEREAQSLGPAVRQHELEELAQIYVNRGLTPDLAIRVAEQLTAKDVIRAHARDELGIDIDTMANPLQAALVSGATFTMGAAIPLLAGSFIQDWRYRLISVITASTVGLASLGLVGAMLGGARIAVGATRVVVGGLLAMTITYGIGNVLA